jgi:hypothetical protein
MHLKPSLQATVSLDGDEAHPAASPKNVFAVADVLAPPQSL